MAFKYHLYVKDLKYSIFTRKLCLTLNSIWVSTIAMFQTGLQIYLKPFTFLVYFTSQIGAISTPLFKSKLLSHSWFCSFSHNHPHSDFITKSYSFFLQNIVKICSFLHVYCPDFDPSHHHLLANLLPYIINCIFSFCSCPCNPVFTQHQSGFPLLETLWYLLQSMNFCNTQLLTMVLHSLLFLTSFPAKFNLSHNCLATLPPATLFPEHTVLVLVPWPLHSFAHHATLPFTQPGLLLPQVFMWLSYFHLSGVNVLGISSLAVQPHLLHSPCYSVSVCLSIYHYLFHWRISSVTVGTMISLFVILSPGTGIE